MCILWSGAGMSLFIDISFINNLALSYFTMSTFDLLATKFVCISLTTSIMNYVTLHGGFIGPLAYIWLRPPIGRSQIYLSRIFINLYMYIFLCRFHVCGRQPVPPVNYVLLNKLWKTLPFCNYSPTSFYNLVLLMAIFQVGFPRVNGH